MADEGWKRKFGSFLKLLRDRYSLTTHQLASACKVSDGAARGWIRGDRVPSIDPFELLCEYLSKAIKQNDVDGEVVARVKGDFDWAASRNAFQQLRYLEADPADYACFALRCYRCMSTGEELPFEGKVLPKPSGKTRAVVFDFAGTLVMGLEGDSTWWHLCREMRIDESRLKREREYSSSAKERADYVRDVTAALREAGLTRDRVIEIGSRLRLYPGVKELFEALSALNIRICIVSRSERDIIKSALGSIWSMVDEVQSNAFEYRADGSYAVEDVVITDFDYEGKAAYVARLAADMHVSCEDVVFVGNSDNDVYVRRTGARTFCVNPRNTDSSDESLWSKSFVRLENLYELIGHITSQPVTESSRVL